MTITATPAISVAGLAPVGTLLAVQELSLTWGRSSLLEHPTPARAALTLLDLSPDRAFAARRDLIGQPVVLGWSGSDGSNGTNFRGRVTDVAVSRYTRNGAPSGALVELSASSQEVDLANYVPPAGTTWPAETFAARLSRLLALLPSGLIAGATLPAAWTGYTATGLAVGDTDVLSLLRTLYDSTGRAMLYDPASNTLTYGPRRFIDPAAAGSSPYTATLTRLTDRGNRWGATMVPAIPGGYLAARDFEYDGAVSTGQDSTITRVALNYQSAATGSTATRELILATTPTESVIGRRTLSVSTWHTTDTATIDLMSAEWASLAANEATLPRLDPATYSTARQPFAAAADATRLLAGVEGPSWWFLQGSWLPQVGVSPARGIAGAAIRYAAGEWTIGLRLAPTLNGRRPVGLPIRYAAADDTVRLTDLDESLTFADCDHINIGAGYTAATMPT